MPPLMVQRDDVDKLPPGSGSVEPPPWGAPRPPLVRLDWLALAVLCLFLLLACPLLYWLFKDAVREWYLYNGGAGWVKTFLVTGFVFAVLFGLKRLFLIDQPGGFKVPVMHVDGRKVIEGALQVQQVYAANEKRNVRALTYSPTYHHQVETNSEALAALPPPEDAIILTPDSDWLRWVDRAPHLLLAGKTEAGKTTMASALLAERILAGDQVLIMDPHYQPGKWFGVEAVSGIPAILETLPALIGELEARYDEFKLGKQTEEFERLTVLIDEVPAIVEKCIEMTASGRPKVTDWRWRRFAKRLGSEARKVRISVVLLSQSTLVQDLMINIQMKENFTRIGLGDQARPLLAEEPLPKRKQALFDLLRGQAHPAAMEYRGDFYLLDTSGVKELSERNVRGRARAWNPEDAPALQSDPDDTAALGTLLTAPMTNGYHNGGSVRPSAREFTQTATIAVPPSAVRRTDGRTLKQERMKDYLKALAAAGRTREEARAWAESRGLRFENRLWTQVRDELGLR